jgi:ATP-dependent helicase/nuclease subunit A
MLNPLQNQQLASDPKNSVWVMASAGSGKTKVLTDRILRLLLEDVAPHKILCLTYTKVASVEMQERLNQELQNWIICSDEELFEKLLNLTGSKPEKTTLSKARGLLIKNLDAELKIKIQTIHSFCQSILKSFPFEAKIPINFELLEENQAKILLKNSQKNVLQNAFNDEKLHELIFKINSQTSDENFTSLVSNLLRDKDKINFIKHKYFGIDNAIKEIYKNFNLDFENNNFSEILAKIYNAFIENLNFSQLKFFSLELAKSPGKNDLKYYENIKNFITNPTIEKFNFLYKGFFTEKNTPRKFSKKIDEIFGNEINRFCYVIDEFNQQYQALVTIENSADLIKIVVAILDDFQKNKTENCYLDYGDLINIANQILENPDFCEWIKLKMDSSFDHILIDEAQDTNPIQWSIIKSLTDDFFSGESSSEKLRSIFVVGDEKQSIMGFQGANINQTKLFHDYFSQKSNYKLQNIDLNISFRSGVKILNLVDAVFNNSESGNNQLNKALCKIGKYVNHQSFRQTAGYVEIWQNNEIYKNQKFDNLENNENSGSLDNQDLETNQNSSKNSKKSSKKIATDFTWKIDFGNQNIDDSKDITAKFIAQKIRKWVDEKRLIKDKNRPVNFGDIMILVRNRKNGLIEKLSQNFNQLKIPFVSVGKIKFSENLLIQDFLSLAKFALLPSDCFNLACLLKSPFFNVDEDELFELCKIKNDQQKNLWSSLQSSKHLKSLENIINLSKTNDVFEFFFKILNDQQNQINIASRFTAQGLEIIDSFFFICLDFNQKNSINLQNFIEFVEKIDPEITLNSTASNQIKITTIHSSKGLQAPIVIMPDCLYAYSNQLDNKEKIIWLNDFPLWINKDSKINSLIKKISEDKIYENYDEHLRLLYVALTRAEDEIYIGGLNGKKDEKCWYEIINRINNENFLKTEFDPIENNFTNKNISTKITLKNSDYNFINKNSNYAYSIINQGLTTGEILHKLLETIGKNYKMPKIWLNNLINNYIKNSTNLSATNQQNISQIIDNFLNSKLFLEIFDNNFDGKILCEYEIYHQQKNLRIDLIKESKNEILIIDYKSDETMPNHVPNQYLDQLHLYKKALQKLYPRHQINCAILWIRFLEMTLIN